MTDMAFDLDRIGGRRVLDALVDEVLAAGEEALGFFRDASRHRLADKSDRSPVTEADHAVEARVQAAVARHVPQAAFLGEETGHHAGDEPLRFVVDPIDGTRAFLKNRPEFVVSVAVIEDGAPVAAALYDPSTERLWDAVKGEGARVNGVAIAHSGRTRVAGARILGDPGRLPGLRALGAQADTVNSAALRLALCAQGVFDAVVAERGKWDWDLAAGALILTEAGARITDRAGAALRFNGDPPRQPAPLAAGPALHALLIERLNKGEDE